MDQQRFAQASSVFETGLSFEQIASFAARRAVSVLGLTVLGIAVGIGAGTLLPKEWEATNVLQVGQITRTIVTNGNTSIVVQPLEPTARTVDRMSLPQFQDSVLESLGLPLERKRNRETALIRDYAQVSARPGDLFSITARGRTPDEAKQVVAAYENLIIGDHLALVRPSVDRMQSELDQAKSALLAAQKREVELNAESAKQLKSQDGRFSADVLRDNLVQRNEEELHGFGLHIEELQEDLNPARTYNTRPLIARIDVGDRPVFPKNRTTGALGALAGFAVGICFGLWRDRRRTDSHGITDAGAEPPATSAT